MQLTITDIAIAAGLLIATVFVIRIAVKSKNSGNKVEGNFGNVTIGDNNKQEK